MKKEILAWLFAFLPIFVFAQATVSGRVTDAATQDMLIGATVRITNPTQGTTTDSQGDFYLPNMPAGKYELVVSYVGYQSSRQIITVQDQPLQLTIALAKTTFQADEVMVTATRANEKTATTFTNVTKEEIQARNFGQDLPYLLDQTPSVVVNSDAGAGVGYTGIRIRGSDITRINVTVNGIPINDAESHGAFFVNMPDLGSSIQDVQVQRGIGTSTNGAAAFGASLNIRTTGFNQEAYAELNNTYGSFNTWKNTVAFGTGLIKNKFFLDGRLSRISSDGYVDRAFSNLKSYYLAGGYQGKTGMVKFITFSGQEQTYQSWYGVPEEKLATDRTYNYYTYDNQTDNYQQDHYQLHYSKLLGKQFDWGGAFHLTRGRGYYEEFREDDDLADYLLPAVVINDSTISSSDIIRRKWLDNYFYGATYALNYNALSNKLTATLGGSWNRYDGDHFGEITWARYASTSNIRQHYYDGTALKTDFNIFGKATYLLSDKLSFYGDLQYRTINYEITGTDDDQRDISQQVQYNFFNPKAGVTYVLADNQTVYASYAVGNREPVRSDFVDRKGDQEPKPETMYNLEAGYRFRNYAGNADILNPVNRFSLDANLFYMDYKNQLVLTGQLNNVGSALRTNIKDSYRAGLELSGLYNLGDKVEVSSNLTVSRNKIQNYAETVYEYNENYDVENTFITNYQESDISFSPNVISGHRVEVQPLTGFKAALLLKTVSKQYLDNTSSEDRKINGYQVLDLRLRYILKPTFMRELELALLVNNILNKKYEANGYTFSEQYTGDPTRYFYNYYYPQATRNYLLSLNLRF